MSARKWCRFGKYDRDGWLLTNANIGRDQVDRAPLQFGESEATAVSNDMAVAAPAMYEALKILTRRYTRLVDSGDCGHWNPETDGEVVRARAALAQARGETPEPVEGT